MTPQFTEEKEKKRKADGPFFNVSFFRCSENFEENVRPCSSGIFNVSITRGRNELFCHFILCDDSLDILRSCPDRQTIPSPPPSLAIHSFCSTSRCCCCCVFFLLVPSLVSFLCVCVLFVTKMGLFDRTNFFFFFFFPLSHLRAHKYTQPKLSWQLSAVCWPKEIHHKHWHPLRPVRGLYDGSGLSLSHSLRHLSLSQLSFLFRFYFTLCLAVGGVPSRWSGLKLTLPPHPMHTETAAPVSAHCVWYRIDRIDGRSRLPSVSLSCAEPQTTCRDASLNLRWKPYMAIDTADEKSYPPNKVTFVRGYIAYTRLKYTYVLKIKTRRCCYPRYLTWSSWRKSSFSGGQKRDKSTSKVDECRPTFSAKLSLNVSGETMFSSCCAKLVIE